MIIVALSLLAIVFALRAPRAACAFLLLAPLAALAQAAPVVPSPDDLELYVRAILDAVQGGQWAAVTILVLIGVVSLLRKYGTRLPRVGPFLASKRGGAILAWATGIVGTLAPSILTGSPITLRLVLLGVVTGAGMIGGWVGIRRIIWGDAVDGVAAEAAAKVVPVPAGATLEELGAELDRPVR